jgi:hypothetical protein
LSRKNPYATRGEKSNRTKAGALQGYKKKNTSNLTTSIRQAASMNQVTKFDGTHEDLIHDVAFNYYGNRLGKTKKKAFLFFISDTKGEKKSCIEV